MQNVKFHIIEENSKGRLDWGGDKTPTPIPYRTTVVFFLSRTKKGKFVKKIKKNPAIRLLGIAVSSDET